MAQDLITATLKPGASDGIVLYRNQSVSVDLSNYVDLKNITGQTIPYPYSGAPIIANAGFMIGKTVSKISSGRYGTFFVNTDGTVGSFGWTGGGVTDKPFQYDETEPYWNTSAVIKTQSIFRSNDQAHGFYRLTIDGDWVGPHINESDVIDFTVGYTDIDQFTPSVFKTTTGLKRYVKNNLDVRQLVVFTTTEMSAMSGKTITQLESYSNKVLALCSDNTIFTITLFGQDVNFNWQPVSLNGALTGKTVTKLVGSEDRIFAICADGTVAGLGVNQYGKLGNGNSNNQTTWAAVIMTGVLSGKTITDVSPGLGHTLFLCSDGTVATVGLNSSGQLGNGSTANSTSVVKVYSSGHLNGKTPIAISAGGYHSVVLNSDGTVHTWGSDSYGQLGNGETTGNSSIPIPTFMFSFTKYMSHVQFSSVNLPNGLSFDGNLVETGRIIGTPTTNGTTNALIKIDLSDFTLYNPIPTSGNFYDYLGTGYLTLPIVVTDPAPPPPPPPPPPMIANPDRSFKVGEPVNMLFIAREDLNFAQWRVFSDMPNGLAFNNFNAITGEPTIIGEYDVTIELTYKKEWNSPLVTVTKTITITITQNAPTINLGAFQSTWNGSVNVLSSPMQQGKAVSLQINAEYAPDSFAAAGLPPGLSINTSTGLITGTPTTPGTYMVRLTATNEVGTSPEVILRMDVTEITVPTFLNNGGVDMFFDLQSRSLSLTPPKAEATIAAGSQVVNKLEASKLIVKTGETLWLNLRFTKGTTPLDPEATGLRFGVAGKVGGPLLMEGSEFTKFGVGAGAYYRMRVTSIENEFGAIIDDYYDDDAVEQISDAKEKEASASGEIEGLCEVVLTTGSGTTIADLKSDTLGVTLKRSLFSA